jgi:hypothetical protein
MSCIYKLGLAVPVAKDAGKNVVRPPQRKEASKALVVPQVTPVNPLPQREQGPLPISSQAVTLTNTASRHLANLAPSLVDVAIPSAYSTSTDWVKAPATSGNCFSLGELAENRTPSRVATAPVVAVAPEKAQARPKPAVEAPHQQTSAGQQSGGNGRSPAQRPPAPPIPASARTAPQIEASGQHENRPEGGSFFEVKRNTKAKAKAKAGTANSTLHKPSSSPCEPSVQRRGVDCHEGRQRGQQASTYCFRPHPPRHTEHLHDNFTCGLPRTKIGFVFVDTLEHLHPIRTITVGSDSLARTANGHSVLNSVVLDFRSLCNV